MIMKTKVLALTGIRSEYDLLFPLLKALDKDNQFDLRIVVSGAHLSPLHNYSISQIEKDGFYIADKIETLLYSDSLMGKVKSSAVLMQSLPQTLEREKPDFLIILGDREEAIIGALTAAYMNIPVIHLAGGDNTLPKDGDVDEQVRHATTKLSHVHLTMTEAHSERIRKLGEENWRIHTVGSGGIDRLRAEPEISVKQMSNFLGNGVENDYVILIYHSLPSNIDVISDELKICFESIIEQDLHVYVGSPNSDPGSQKILEVIDGYKHYSNVHIYNNLPRTEFVNLLRNAKCLIGNSSLAFHEASYLGLPAINIGERQRGRTAGENVKFVNSGKKEFQLALKRAVHDPQYRYSIKKDRFIYGDGYMAEKSIEILKKLPSKRELLAKRITY
ncbi:UDP-N-acetylglucosamine 2-epimerase [Virgibacillus doumboii]|uniref:UDP-N-acetylglucosamine 2-epimerase n=1 Tax=Virgibacillus doumboii TaxID=2697503 RepID=UPI00196888AA|nr:UDP-N-acetylglucosamine 2-epimerase [Virgibacillus doumboii]